jgi:hypothetical protein
MRFLSICLLIATSLFQAIAQEGSHSDQRCGERALKMVRSLEIGNPLRESVERGNYGDCVRYDWMGKMGKFGIKHASYLVEYEWKGKSVDFTIKRTSYLTTYYTDFNTYTIKDGVRLREITDSGLDQELKNVVLASIQKSGFSIRDKNSVRKDVFQLDLFDDESLPRLYMIF